jgi:hypothetical protein
MRRSTLGWKGGGKTTAVRSPAYQPFQLRFNTFLAHEEEPR